MTADLSFLKELPHSAAFRPVRGYDACLDLYADEVAELPARRGVYVLVAADGRTFRRARAPSSTSARHPTCAAGCGST